jgi:hypothetical protein
VIRARTQPNHRLNLTAHMAKHAYCEMQIVIRQKVLGRNIMLDRSDPCSTGLARVHQRLCEVSAVVGRTGTKRPTDK